MCGPAPLLGCQTIRVRVLGLYMYPSPTQHNQQSTILHGIKLGFDVALPPITAATHLLHRTSTTDFHVVVPREAFPSLPGVAPIQVAGPVHLPSHRPNRPPASSPLLYSRWSHLPSPPHGGAPCLSSTLLVVVPLDPPACCSPGVLAIAADHGRTRGCSWRSVVVLFLHLPVAAVQLLQHSPHVTTTWLTNIPLRR